MVGQGIDKFVFPIWGISKGHTIIFQFVSQVVNISTIYVSFPTLSVCSGIVLSDFYKFVIFGALIFVLTYFPNYIYHRSSTTAQTRLLTLE